MRAELEEIKTGIALELQATEGFRKRELLEPANRYRLAVAFGLFLGQQCTGMTVSEMLPRADHELAASANSFIQLH